MHPLSLKTSGMLPMTLHPTAAAVELCSRCTIKPKDMPLRQPQSQADAPAWAGSPQSKLMAQQQASGPLTRCSPSTALDS